ncbi:MAG: SusD/RagB family nutrient-binding outer membrane lipoprotein, partial [Bacteroidales bacterium]|nr:SusD/RagB family nutrient-binding outer membrane lipoprotein [Candidatus Cryptobacteroides equifaecalis]
MNNIKNIMLAFVAVGALALTSCSKEYMTAINTDDTKTSTVDPNNLLTTGMLQTFGDFDMMDTYRCYITGFAQYYAGGWNVATYAGQNMYNDDYSRKVWDKLYSVGIKNIVQAIDNTADQKNLNAALRVYRVYLLSQIVDCYGDAPCEEAGMGAIGRILYPKYDTVQEAYNFFFDELTKCASILGTGTDKITGDVSTMAGNTDAWRKFANSLRLRFAMRISSVDPEKAKTEFEAVMATKGDYITIANENVLIKYLSKSFTFYQGAADLDFRANALSETLWGQDPTSPTLVCKTFYRYLQENDDPRLYCICRNYLNAKRNASAADGCHDLTEEVIAWGETQKALDPASKAGIQPNEVGEAWYNNWPVIPETKDLPTLARLVQEDPNAGYDKNNYPARLTRPFLNIAFEQANCPGVVFTSAETEYLLAEAKYMGWAVEGEVKDHFKAGVRASLEFLNTNYNIKKIEQDVIDDYVARVELGANPKEAINLQA